MTTRIPRDELLEHPARQRLLDLIRQAPGIELHRLHARLNGEDPEAGCAFASLYHHLRLLERFGRVTSRRAGRFRRYYENGGPQGASTTALSVLQNHPMPTLAHLIHSHPGATQTQVWTRFRERFPCTRQTVGYHLRRLESHALAEGSRRGAAKRYYPTATLNKLLPMVSRGVPSPAAAEATP